jgi:hypothetical protein
MLKTYLQSGMSAREIADALIETEQEAGTENEENPAVVVFDDVPLIEGTTMQFKDALVDLIDFIRSEK